MAGETDNKGGSGDGNNGDDAAKKAAEDAKANEDGDKQRTVPHQAFHAEREARKEAERKLAALESEKIAAAKKAQEEQGEFKTLYEKEQERAKKLEEDLKTHQTKLTDFETKATERINKQLESVKVESDKATIKAILEGKSLAAQEDLLPTLLTKFGVPANVNAGPQGSGGKGANDRAAKEADAKKTGDVRSMIKNAPRLNT